MARRVGMGGRTGFGVTARWGRRVARCLGVEVSSTGIVVYGTELVKASPLWVWLELEDRWAAFSILSRGMPKPTAVAIEDRIVRTIARGARVPD